jgi:hypothetical protein
MQPPQALVQVQYAPAEQQEQRFSLFDVPGFNYSRTGLQIDQDVPYEQWERYGMGLKWAKDSIEWAIGDWINFGEAAYGEKYAQAIAITGKAYQTLMNNAFVASRFPIYRRRENLAFDIYSSIAPLQPDEQDKILDEAEATDASVREVRLLVKLHKAEKQAKRSGKFFDANIEAARIFWERLRPQIEEFQQIFPPAALHVPTFLDDVNEALDMSFNDPPQFILEALEQQPRTTQELLKATGYCRDTLEALLKELEAAGSIAELSQGQVTEMARGAVQTVWVCVEG